MPKPKVSVIVPVYNTEKYLKRCLDSLMGQTLKDLEIILVDDGSKEPCALLCDEFAQKDSRIKVIHKANAGAGFARNAGLAVATGEYIGFVDSDDFVDLQMYEKLYEAAVHYDADLVLSGVCYVSDNAGSEAQEYFTKTYFTEDTIFEKEGIQKLLLGIVGALPHEKDDSRYGLSVWKNLFRNSVIQENEILFLSEREVVSEDTIYMVDYIRYITRAVGVPGSYYHYCHNGSSISKSYNPRRIDGLPVFFRELEKHVANYTCEEAYEIYLKRLTQGFVRVACIKEIVHAREENIPFCQLQKRLKKLCASKMVRSALASYPWYRLPVKQAAFAFTMKYELYFFQKIMALLKER